MPAEEAHGMTGLDIMQAIRDDHFPYAPIAETLDFLHRNAMSESVF